MALGTLSEPRHNARHASAVTSATHLLVRSSALVGGERVGRRVVVGHRVAAIVERSREALDLSRVLGPLGDALAPSGHHRVGHGGETSPRAAPSVSRLGVRKVVQLAVAGDAQPRRRHLLDGAPGPSNAVATPATSTAGAAGAMVSARRAIDAAPTTADAGAGAAITAANLPEAFAIDATRLTASCVVLVMVSLQTVPLVLAYLDGLRLIGFDLAVRPMHAVAAAEQLAEAIIEGSGATTYTAGRAENHRGAAVFTSPVAYVPPPSAVATTERARQRRRRAGQAVAWVTLAALAGTPVGAVSSCAVWAASALGTEVGALPTLALPGMGGVFRFGVTAIASIVDRPAVPLQPTHAEATLMRSLQEGNLLRDLLLETGEQYYADWASRIQPPEMAEFPAGLLEQVTSFTDASLGRLPFPKARPPPTRARTPLKPQQPPTDLCPRSARDILYENDWRRAMRWVSDTANDLVCIREHGDDCERRRPGVLVLGQSSVRPPFRGFVWDFRNSPAECGKPLDHSEPLDHTLNVDFFRRRLRDYPNQHILGFIESGVLYDADVELQTVLVPHLMSLSKGYESVVKELNRMAAPELQWYTYHADFPFWPMYSLGEGCVPRKLENRWRRCEEGGGPRKEVCDGDGIRALSLNEASRTYHFPQHYAQDERPEWLEYLRQRRLPATAEMVAAAAANRGSKWAKQYMPDLTGIMKAMMVLKHAAQRMGESLYIFGDDAKDYFNHLANAAEELWKLNTIFLDGGEHLEEAIHLAHDGSKVAFIQERRMGFGLHGRGVAACDEVPGCGRCEVGAAQRRGDAAAAARAKHLQPVLHLQRHEQARAHNRIRAVTALAVGPVRRVEAVHGAAREPRNASQVLEEPDERAVVGELEAVGTEQLLDRLGRPQRFLLRDGDHADRGEDEGADPDAPHAKRALLRDCHDHTRIGDERAPLAQDAHGARSADHDDGVVIAVHACVVESALVAAVMLLDVSALLEPRLCRRARIGLEERVLLGVDVLAQEIEKHLAELLGDVGVGDSTPPGLGGFMHGFWWRIELTRMYVVWLHITVLELLASGFSAMMFAPLVPPANRLLPRSPWSWAGVASERAPAPRRP